MPPRHPARRLCHSRLRRRFTIVDSPTPLKPNKVAVSPRVDVRAQRRQIALQRTDRYHGNGHRQPGDLFPQVGLVQDDYRSRPGLPHLP